MEEIEKRRNPDKSIPNTNNCYGCFFFLYISAMVEMRQSTICIELVWGFGPAFVCICLCMCRCISKVCLQVLVCVHVCVCLCAFVQVHGGYKTALVVII